jgi:hypothetical protein
MAAEEASEELVRGLEDALVQAFPGMRVLERELCLPGGARADLVAIDETGRVVLVLVADGLAEETCLAALDLLAHGRMHLKLLTRHLAEPLARADLEPRVFLVAQDFSERLKSRLAPLMSERVLLLEIRELSSSRGNRSYLVTLDPPALSSEPRAAAIEDFLAALAPDARGLALSAVQRMGRLDHELECAVSALEVRWRLGERLLGALRRTDQRLEGYLPRHGEPVAIVDGNALEVFLERALEGYLDLLGEAREGEDELPEVEIAPMPAGPLLTPEEIRAFLG